MPKKYNTHALWVSMQDEEENIFTIYPKMLSEILRQDDDARTQGDTSEVEGLVLPSDWEWRLQQYFMLVEMQKPILEPNLLQEEVMRKPPEDLEEWAPWRHAVPMASPNAPAPITVRSSPGAPWDMKQVLKAAQLLSQPPLTPQYTDEQEMRAVYSIIYDVFRYKTILNQAIDDVEFFGDYPKFYVYRRMVWLFLMELARRRWEARPRGELEAVDEALEKEGYPFADIEKAVWNQRVHFAAAIARIRIKNKAFELAELLPAHLRNDRIQVYTEKETVTGWVNTFKAKKIAALVKSLHEMGYSYSNSRMLCAGEYRFDRVCPRFITLRPPPDSCVGQMSLVKDGVIVLQEREFCEGASTLCRVLRANELRGVVAQTHASSPRCSAYLAAQLRELAVVLRAKSPAAPVTPELGKLVVFGAGDKVDSYVESLRHLGVEASVVPQEDALVIVYSEPVYCDTPAVVAALDGVVAVLATPPNSYSSVSDPIDLVCGRGGDLAMLEILTESQLDEGGKQRVAAILEEQKKTLKALMSKPQIQIILYETHSSQEAENQAQVTRAIAESNRLARERHAFLRKKPGTSAKTKERLATIESSTTFDNTISRSDIVKPDMDDLASLMGNDETDGIPIAKKVKPLSSTDNFLLRKLPEKADSSRPNTTKARPIPPGLHDKPPTPASEESKFPKNPDKDMPDEYAPNCDLFEIGNLPPIGNGLDINYILERDGCYLGLIQRKELTRLDARYMIKVAEERGLFGAESPPPPAPRRRKADAVPSPRRRRRKHAGFEVDRVAAPTYSSLSRSRRGSAPASMPPGVVLTGDETHVCEKHVRRQAAANALTTANCTCDARHRGARQQIRRRASADVSREEAAPAPAACRRPFPVTVHDLRLVRLPLSHRKVLVN